MAVASQALQRTMFAACVAGLAAHSLTCTTAESPQACLMINNSAGEKACSWLILKGQCTDVFSQQANATPPNCCSSMAEYSHCGHNITDLHDGLCTIKQSSSVVPIVPSLDVLKRMVHLAFASYCSDSQIENWTCGEHCSATPNISEQEYIDNVDQRLAAFVAWDSMMGCVLVSFKGTNPSEIKNWVTNLNILKKSPFEQYPESGVHEGFWEAWLALKNEDYGVLAHVKKLASDHNTTSVCLTGHSLGAAIATNAAIDLHLNYGYKTSVVNFGSPRVGDYDYHKAMQENVPVFRVTHRNDAVVHLPAQWMGFYHTAFEIYFPNASGLVYKFCDGSGEDDDCANSCSSFLCFSIDDHMHYFDMTDTCASPAAVLV